MKNTRSLETNNPESIDFSRNLFFTECREYSAKYGESCYEHLCVVIQSGDIGNTAEVYIKMTREALDVGVSGVTFGRFVGKYIS